MTTRPTPAKVREALFSIIAAHVPGAQVLDLFAGTGALGIEALSRGALHATFVEVDPQVLPFLRRNLAAFGTHADVLPIGVAQATRRLAGAQKRFDLIFMDPPYPLDLLQPTLAQLATQALLSPEGVVVCEHHGQAAPPQAPAGWVRYSSRVFGDVALSLFGYAEGSTP